MRLFLRLLMLRLRLTKEERQVLMAIVKHPGCNQLCLRGTNLAIPEDELTLILRRLSMAGLIFPVRIYYGKDQPPELWSWIGTDRVDGPIIRLIRFMGDWYDAIMSSPRTS